MNPSRIRSIAFLLAALPGVASAQAAHDEGVLARADSLMKLGRPAETIPLLNRAVARDPNNSAYLLARGRSYGALKEYDKAKEDYVAAILIDPECARCQLELGAMEAINGDPRAALAFLNRAIELKNNLPAGDLAEAHSMRAQIHEAMGERPAAAADYDEAVRLLPGSADYRINRGMFHMLGGEMPAALENFDAAVQAHPGSAKPYFYRSRYYATTEQWDRALEDLNRCVTIDSGDAGSLLARGTVYLNMKRYNEALADYDRVLARDPASTEGYYNRSIARYQMEDLDGSCHDSRKVLELLERGKNDPEMLIEIRRTMQRHCDSAYSGYYYHRGIAAYNRNDFAGAIANYDRGLKQFPNDPLLLYFRGNAHLASGAYEAAIKDYVQVLHAREEFLERLANFTPPDTATETSFLRTSSLMSVHHSLFEARYALKDYDGALRDLDRTLETATEAKLSGTEKLYFERGSLLMLQGKREEAVQDLDRAIAISPDFAPAYLFKAIALLNHDQPDHQEIPSIDLAIEDATSSGPHIEWPAELGSSDTSTTTLERVLYAANKAIELDPLLGYAYVVRGYASMLSKKQVYCDDFLKAEGMGVKEAEPLMRTYCR